MNDQDRQNLTTQLEAGHDRLLDAVNGLTPAQWSFRPGDGRWTINECLDHVMRVESRIVGLIEKKVAGPPESRNESLPPAKDDEIPRLITDRSNRREAPEAVRPTGERPDPKDLLTQFRKTRSHTEQFASGTDADLRSYFIPHGLFGELDCYQWLIVLGAHAQRHALQIDEVKEHSAFPAS